MRGAAAAGECVGIAPASTNSARGAALRPSRYTSAPWPAMDLGAALGGTRRELREGDAAQASDAEHHRVRIERRRHVELGTHAAKFQRIVVHGRLDARSPPDRDGRYRRTGPASPAVPWPRSPAHRRARSGAWPSAAMCPSLIRMSVCGSTPALVMVCTVASRIRIVGWGRPGLRASAPRAAVQRALTGSPAAPPAARAGSPSAA